MGDGLRDGLNLETLKSISAPLPPIQEQYSIEAYLAHADRRINRLIRTKRRLIALLNEQKQAIIQRAITHGLDPNVRLKPSGLEWLGDVPEHWEFGAMRRFWDVKDCKHVTVPFVEDGIPLASVSEAQTFDLNLSASKKTTEEWYQHLVTGERNPKRGDLIYCRNTSVGASAYVDTDTVFAMGQDVCLITSKVHNQRFLNYVLHAPLMAHQLNRLLVGSTFKRINISDILALLVVAPPRVEQDEISNALDKAVAENTLAIRQANQTITLLREYRTRIVADVVTGKLDVRGVVMSDLDDTEETEDLDLVDEIDVEEFEGDEESADAAD